ncbi:hypothetical protein O6H91_13G030300 [Diphasiastrum complanatum]|uniref:Uncharacterized protein n=1 Tax=Diphasiastrum complanatum TaxID=34168 RepID=A0ACC2BUF4_DIPCM|nr:hypothetical protein O6H91_13G030300 [Diphasiastrum complanatum]
MEARGYEAALMALSSLITKRKRGDDSNKGDNFYYMNRYLEILTLEEPLSRLSVIHVAGTKGKGSTCAFSESILKECGYRTALFTSPHLVDVRERFRFNGVEVSEDLFLKYFWWCWDRLKDGCQDVPMPAYFRFLTLLAFKMFTAEKVDVAILEVGLGGKYDGTNVIKAPDVCGISSLGFDHMEILGHTLPEIAGEKAGIFKVGVPAYTAPQREDALFVLKEKASDLDISLEVVKPLEARGIQLGLAGDHQLINAALAVALCNTWILKRGSKEHVAMAKQDGGLPELYVKGLKNVHLSGRAQVVRDTLLDSCENVVSKSITFYLDGAHSPESMEACAKWFCEATRLASPVNKSSPDSAGSNGALGIQANSEAAQYELGIRKVLLFNCMPERDPHLLFPPLLNVCAQHGVQFHKALFVPGYSSYTFLGTNLSSATGISKPDTEPDLTWQRSLLRTWESLLQEKKHAGSIGCDNANKDFLEEDKNFGCNSSLSSIPSSAVVPSLPLALEWLRKCVRQHPTMHIQVLVAGSLHLVGDVLRLLKR